MKRKTVWERWGRKTLKFFLLAAALLMIFVLSVFSACAVKGHSMYRNALESLPIDALCGKIQSADDFVRLDELPDIYIDAVISAEDQRFWRHHGFDCLAILRAAWNDIRTLSFAEGGSTITQQLMKNQYFTQEKKIERKFAEVFAAVELEKHCSKDEILEMYLNTIYFGSGYYGISDAAEGYFHKKPCGLTDAEAILLAGIPNAPSAYSPDVNPNLAKKRMRRVLDRMIDCKKITEETANRIYSEYP